MHIKKRDLITIRTTQIARMIKWYSETLGLRKGYRPACESPGTWLYADNTVVIELIKISKQEAIFSQQGGKSDHVALSAFGAPEFEASLDARQQRYQSILPKASNKVLYKVWDPDGNAIHIDFPAIELLMNQEAS